MQTYLNLLKKIIENGIDSSDRTCTGTLSLFGEQLRFDLTQGFPAVTTKKLAWRSVVSELLWFIEGSGDERRLAEIHWGTRDPSKTTIWAANANSEYWKPNAEFSGDLGRIYGVQWRNWRRAPVFKNPNQIPDVNRVSWIPNQNGSYLEFLPDIDQLKNLINGLKTDPSGRRHIISAWNPGELDQMALPPCHLMAQFYLRDNKLSCMMTQRSCDAPLGLPFNIASYALLTHLIAKTINSEVQELIINLGDVHIYKNQIDGINEQLARSPYELPILDISSVTDIWTAKVDDCKLINYKHHPSISFPFAV